MRRHAYDVPSHVSAASHTSPLAEGGALAPRRRRVRAVGWGGSSSGSPTGRALAPGPPAGAHAGAVTPLTVQRLQHVEVAA